MLKKIIKNIKNKNIKIVFPEGNEAKILEAASYLKTNNLAEPILIKNNSIESHEKFKEMADQFYELRKHKGITKQEAVETLRKSNYFATMLIKNGLAEGYVGGITYSTADTLRPALQIFKSKKKTKVSSYMIMSKNEKVCFFSDIAININPSTDELVNIAIQTHDSVLDTWNIKPKMAMLSFSTNGSGGSSEFVTKVRKATEIIQHERPEIIIEGEMQFDAAFVKEIGIKKMPSSKIAGQANTFIFPNLDSGNIGYKMVQYLGNWKATGPIIQGLERPVNDLSRGATVEDIIEVSLITAQQCLDRRNNEQ